jgi:hypothetical protein
VLWIVYSRAARLVTVAISSAAHVYAGPAPRHAVGEWVWTTAPLSPELQRPGTRSSIEVALRSVCGLDLMDEVGDLLVHLALLCHQAGHLLLGMHHRCVVAIAELTGDGWIAVIG